MFVATRGGLISSSGGAKPRSKEQLRSYGALKRKSRVSINISSPTGFRVDEISLRNLKRYLPSSL